MSEIDIVEAWKKKQQQQEIRYILFEVGKLPGRRTKEQRLV